MTKLLECVPSNFRLCQQKGQRLPIINDLDESQFHFLMHCRKVAEEVRRQRCFKADILNQKAINDLEKGSDSRSVTPVHRLLHLMYCIMRRRPRLFHLVDYELSSEEAWLVSLFSAVKRNDNGSISFLLRSQLPPNTVRVFAQLFSMVHARIQFEFSVVEKVHPQTWRPHEPACGRSQPDSASRDRGCA